MESASLRRWVVTLWILFYALFILSFSIWFLSNGGFREPWRQLFSFFKTGEIISQNLSLGQWDIVAGFVLFNLWLSIVIVIFCSLFWSPRPEIQPEKPLLDLSPLVLFFKLLGGVTAEEIVFRWFPLAVLLPLWGTATGLWVLIITSSLIFGFLHVYNQNSKNRRLIFTLPQIIGGITLSYIFLAFGFTGAVMTHLAFNVILIFPFWVAHRIDS